MLLQPGQPDGENQGGDVSALSPAPQPLPPPRGGAAPSLLALSPRVSHPAWELGAQQSPHGGALREAVGQRAGPLSGSMDPGRTPLLAAPAPPSPGKCGQLGQRGRSLVPGLTGAGVGGGRGTHPESPRAPGPRAAPAQPHRTGQKLKPHPEGRQVSGQSDTARLCPAGSRVQAPALPSPHCLCPPRPTHPTLAMSFICSRTLSKCP